MGIRIARKKKRLLWSSILYRILKLPFGSKAFKQKLFLNLEWFFDRMAHENSFSIYDEDSHPVRKCTKEYIITKIKPTDRVLDLGCDKGVMSNYLADFAKSVVGIDYSASAISIAKSNYSKSNLEFINEEALTYLKSMDDSFDVLILSHILEHLDDPILFINSFKSFFKYIYIEVPDFDRHYLNQYRQKLNLDLIYSDDDHISEFDRDELTKLLEKADVEILECKFRYGVQKFWCKVKD